MRINNDNFFEKLNELKAKNGKNRVYYKFISFATVTNNGNINFKLAPNILLAIVLFFAFFILTNVLTNLLVIIAFIPQSGFSSLIQLFVAGYASYALSKYLTEKLFKKQIMEFFEILKKWKNGNDY